MGIIKCNIHGNQSFYEVCEHIWDSFENNIVPKMKDLPILTTKICDRCYADNDVGNITDLSFEDILKLPEVEQDKIENNINSKYANLNRRAKCIECLNTLLLNDARRNGKELPFEPYEMTLMHKHQTKIDELKAIITSNHELPNFKNPYLKTEKAFHIKSGGISYPLTLTFYYVTKEEDQMKLIKLIDEFFNNISRKQRKICFYEAENWIVEESKGSTHQYKGEEILLKEIIVK